ncbi:uncharacterized protein F4807DRAFT_465266 [Annulohypoxylon truncatum]|uniref:uncharacterized protein n=1 Tax=Annulohypoxylon truncatum TaxID=327061 RepID=UPI002007B33E|nr:uncharacterized protein F4807DRAFT_465266 [Annulohypoxylon truncatum]KAI1204899.1 hypothetical protein F4807DRAFT_465266 [Annulohypoxylon truncatum]
MPSNKVNNASGEAVDNSLPTIDSEIINVILKNCLQSAKPTAVMWEAVREELEFKTVEVARERFRQLCKKHHWFEGSIGNDNNDFSTPAPTPKKRTPGAPQIPKETRLASSTTSGWDADINSPAPSPKKRKCNKTERASMEKKGQQKMAKGNGAKRCARPEAEVSDSDEA